MDTEKAIAEMKQLFDELTTEFTILHKTRKEAIPKAIRLGELLKWFKDNTPDGDYGNWLDFIRKRIPFSQQSASNYMRVYELNKEGKLPDVSSLSDLYFLLGIKDEDTRASVIAELKRTGKSARAAAKTISNHPTDPGTVIKGSESPEDQRSAKVGTPNVEENSHDKGPQGSERITKDMWKAWRNKSVRERVLNTLGSMSTMLDVSRSEDLDVLRCMLNIDLTRRIKQLEREEKAAIGVHR